MRNKVTILGKEWKIIFKKMNDADGKCCPVIREIWIATNIDENAVDRNVLIRHELIHAFMFECGLGFNFVHTAKGIDETMADWYAIQYPKIKAVYKELEVED